MMITNLAAKSFSALLAAEFLLDIMWDLLSMEEPGLSVIQMSTVLIILLTIGVISAIYNGTMICNIVKIWMSLATVLMLLILVFGRASEGGERR